MIKYLLQIIGIIGIFLCSSKNNNLENCQVIKSKDQEYYFAKQTDDFTILKYKDSTIFDYKLYKVTVIPNIHEIGETIRVLSKNSNNMYFSKGDNFIGLYDNYIIFDGGTGVERGYILIDLITKKQILMFNYVMQSDSLTISNNKLYCYTSSFPDIDKIGHKLPDCSDGEKYDGGGILLELVIFDLKKRTYIYTGKFKYS